MCIDSCFPVNPALRTWPDNSSQPRPSSTVSTLGGSFPIYSLKMSPTLRGSIDRPAGRFVLSSATESLHALQQATSSLHDDDVPEDAFSHRQAGQGALWTSDLSA